MPSSEKNVELDELAELGRGEAPSERPAAPDASDDELEVPEDALGTARRLWEAARGQRWRLVVAAVCSVLYVAGSLGATAYSAGLIDLLWNNIQATFEAGAPFVVTLENGGVQILTFLGIWTAAWGAYTVQVLVMASFAERLNLGLRRRIGEKLSRLPLAYYDAHQPGDTISRATNDLDKVSEVLQRGLLQLLIAVCMVSGAVILMATYDLVLTGVFVVFGLVASVATKLVTARTLKVAAARQAALGDLTGRVEEAYSGRAVIKAFGREDASLAEVAEAAERLAETSATADFVTNAIAPAIRLLMRLCQVTIGLLAGGMLVMGQISVGVFQAFFQYVMQASEPFTQLALTVNMLQGALAAAERVFAFLDEDEVVPDPVSPAELPEAVEGRVAFEHVRFGYAPDRPLMRDVSLVAEPGQKVAIVGATGAGKTTLINLLMRFYEVDGGRITLDGVDTRDLTRAGLRRQFGMVLQDAWLFEGTIAENIAYGKPGATREEVEAAARAAHVDFFVRTLPHGYDTMLSNDAENISQGQRQLLTIARAMLTDPAILILDEATSSVDTRTEQAIVRAMEAIMENRTSFVIAHRLSTIVDADLILVMEKGTIIEQGTHAELLAAGGAYAELYRSQFA
ncbi:ABC transporter ATP-binding protein [Thermophilibacter provencensis]|uniref:Fatty acid ABC transporter ATP-binding/permease protein n=1 Tax=Thermophilibacter provencensis TaxID=1852386 RepID=A0A921GGC6_9ACTN|nr:ABC transporter ATP-binding protein [Thermophilibacter provencensis]HJF45588.1 ABC transporter ATP-binding protein/permease [Thermophilibacter provencensis]